MLPCCSLPRAAVTKYHQVGGLTTEIYSHNSAGQKLEIRCQQGWFLLRIVRKNLFQPLFQLLVIAGDLWCFSGVFSSPCSLLSSSHDFSLCAMSVSKFPPFLRTPVILDQWPTLVQNVVIFNYTCKDLFPNMVMF